MNFENNLNKVPESIEPTGFDYRVRPDESSEEFFGRFLSCLKEDFRKEDKQSDIGGIVLKKKENLFTLINNDKNKAKSERVISLMLEEEKISAGREELNDNKNQENLLTLQENVSDSSREASFSDDQIDSQKYYENTNQDRAFFPDNFKKDGIPYAISLFGVGLQNSSEAEEYLKLKLNDKNVCLLGGGQSCQDLVESQIVKPKSIVNIDPYIAHESIDRSVNNNYISANLKADAPNLTESLKEKNIDKFDEVWASYSVPFYNKNPEEIKNLFSNIKDLLSENGNCRITPISVQEGCKEAFLEEIKKIKDSGEFNIHLMDATLIIHKLKSELNGFSREEILNSDEEDLKNIREQISEIAKQ